MLKLVKNLEEDNLLKVHEIKRGDIVICVESGHSAAYVGMIMHRSCFGLYALDRGDGDVGWDNSFLSPDYGHPMNAYRFRVLPKGTQLVVE